MDSIPLIIATGCYILTAIQLGLTGNFPLCVVFIAYAIANTGLLFAAFY